MTFALRNPSYAIVNPARSWRVSKLCALHVKQYPVCVWCGAVERLQAHHKIPVWKDQLLAEDPTNLITFCAKCHLYIAHVGSFATRYLENIDDVILVKRVYLRV